MLKLYDNGFSPFARKVRIVLDLKGLDYETLDGLTFANRASLLTVNPRSEVPALEHEGLVVVGSSDIIAYLERVFDGISVYPDDHTEWVHARAWERCADTVIDPILINVSYWTWAERSDEMPSGLLEAARNDMIQIYRALERDLDGRRWLAGGALSIADIALFPHISATRLLNVSYEAGRFPRVHEWMRRLRAEPVFSADLQRTKDFLARSFSRDSHDRRKIFWRGDRIEWMLANGHHEWFINEIRQERVLWPGLGVPGPRVSSVAIDTSFRR